MFLKYFKHQTHAACRSMLPLLGGLLVMAILARGSIWLMSATASSAVRTISILLLLTFFFGCLIAVIATMILMMSRFKKSLYSDEGYLTHTLPIGLNTILFSHLLISFLAVVASFATVYLGFRIVVLGVDSIAQLGNFVQRLLDSLDVETGSMLLQALSMTALSILSWILLLWASVAIGYSFDNGKSGKSVASFFVLYFAQQIISAIILSLFPGVAEGDAVQTYLWVSIGEYLFFCAVNFGLTWYMTTKRLNLA